MSDGWIKLHRSTLDNPIVCKDPDHLAVWVYLLLNATHTNYDALFMGKRVTLMPGQLITGRKSISACIYVSEYKVQRILKTFETAQQIAQQTSSQNRLISILNWDRYQENAQQNAQPLHNECTTDAQRVHTNKNDKKERMKEVKNKHGEYGHVLLTEEQLNKLTLDFGKDKVEEFIKRVDEYCQQHGKKYKDYNLTIRNWLNKEPKPEKPKFITIPEDQHE